MTTIIEGLTVEAVEAEAFRRVPEAERAARAARLLELANERDDVRDVLSAIGARLGLVVTFAPGAGVEAEALASLIVPEDVATLRRLSGLTLDRLDAIAAVAVEAAHVTFRIDKAGDTEADDAPAVQRGPRESVPLPGWPSPRFTSRELGR